MCPSFKLYRGGVETGTTGESVYCTVLSCLWLDVCGPIVRHGFCVFPYSVDPRDRFRQRAVEHCLRGVHRANDGRVVPVTRLTPGQRCDRALLLHAKRGAQGRLSRGQLRVGDSLTDRSVVHAVSAAVGTRCVGCVVGAAVGDNVNRYGRHASRATNDTNVLPSHGQGTTAVVGRRVRALRPHVRLSRRFEYHALLQSGRADHAVSTMGVVSSVAGRVGNGATRRLFRCKVIGFECVQRRATDCQLLSGVSAFVMARRARDLRHARSNVIDNAATCTRCCTATSSIGRQFRRRARSMDQYIRQIARLQLGRNGPRGQDRVRSNALTLRPGHGECETRRNVSYAGQRQDTVRDVNGGHRYALATVTREGNVGHGVELVYARRLACHAHYFT